MMFKASVPASLDGGFFKEESSMPDLLKNEDLERAVTILRENETYTCVLIKGDEMLFSDAHGVRALLKWTGEGRDLAGFSSADRIVGKAAALLYVKMGIASVHACTVSEAAVSVLEKHEIPLEYDRRVPQILNRDGSDMCPMEKAVARIDDPAAAPEALAEAVRAMQKK